MLRWIVDAIASLSESVAWPPRAIAFIYGEGDEAVLRLRPGVSPYPPKRAQEPELEAPR